ncbi:MAG: hypothetical protein IJZ96_01790 [Lachnospiraceae bacterium]|nr:hypothetical protein [Lachnospiraceae bacterium]
MIIGLFCLFILLILLLILYGIVALDEYVRKELYSLKNELRALRTVGLECRIVKRKKK